MPIPFLYGMQQVPRRHIAHRQVAAQTSDSATTVSYLAVARPTSSLLQVPRHQDDCYVAGANDCRNIEGGRRSFKVDRRLQHRSTLGIVGDRKVTRRFGNLP